MDADRLSPHFTRGEFRCRDGSPLPTSSVPAVKLLCVRFLEPLRRAYGPVTIMSGFRTASHNRQVGGAPASYHVYRPNRVGVAADVRASRGTPREWAALLETCGPCGLHAYATWVHVDSRPTNARW